MTLVTFSVQFLNRLIEKEYFDTSSTSDEIIPIMVNYPIIFQLSDYRKSRCNKLSLKSPATLCSLLGPIHFLPNFSVRSCTPTLSMTSKLQDGMKFHRIVSFQQGSMQKTRFTLMT